MAFDSYSELVRADEVHRRVYTDPAVFEAEMERIFCRSWLFVAHDSEVPNPGDFKTDTVAGRPIIVVRGNDRQVRVLFNACRHRGARVCYETYGSGRGFRCLYHGWMYDRAGKLIGAPMKERFQNFEPGDDFGLLPVPRVESYRGFIFASLSEAGVSLAEHLGRGRHYLDLMCDRAPDGEIEALRPIKYGYPGNWKLQLENYTDNYHPVFLHQSAFEIGMKMQKEKYSGISFKGLSEAVLRERNFGRGHGMVDYGTTRGDTWMNAYEDPVYLTALERRHTPERARELRDLDLHMTIYPNLLLHTRQNHFRVVKPVAVDRTEVWGYPCRLKGAPERVNEVLVLNTSHHCSAMGEIQVDDMRGLAWVQEGLQADALEWLLFKLHGENEQVNEHGELEWSGAGEGVIRHQYAAWAELMAAP